MNETRERLRELGEFIAELRWERLPDAVRDRARLVLLDTLGVTAAGARTPELRRLIDAWDPPDGPATLIGAGRHTDVDAAVWLNGTAACALELDEGNKYARGHPAAHAAFAALALAQARPTPGTELLAAFVAGHEVAARFGRATTTRPEIHTHGHWGTAGAAAAAGRLLGLSAPALAAALDAATGLVFAPPWASVLGGSFFRNTWIGGAGVHGLVAARIAAAGLADADGTAGHTLGGPLGDFEPDALTDGLGERFDVCHGYFKRHAACSYTHPAADAVLHLRKDLDPGDLRDVASVTVETHRLAVSLAGTRFPTRLAAMFSIPYVVAVALARGTVSPDSFEEDRRRDPLVRRLVDRTTVVRGEELDARLPRERPARVTIRLRDGRQLRAETPNPVGDADHHPFGRAEILTKLDGLLHPGEATALASLVDKLDGAPKAGPLLDRPARRE
ncbi:MAG: MmgE/PrpD family protein [Streptosporangiaceae bacterium]